MSDGSSGRLAAATSTGRHSAIPRAVVLDMMRAFVRTVEKVEPHTASHNTVTARFAWTLARRLKFSPAACRLIHLGGLLHDIGKIGVPADLLLRPKKLSATEFALVKEHPAIGWEIVSELGVAHDLATVIRQHHERLDGSGYPDRLSNGAIMPEAMVVAVADVAIALKVHRPYRGPMETEAIGRLLEPDRDTRLPAPVIDAALALLREQDGMTRH